MAKRFLEEKLDYIIEMLEGMQEGQEPEDDDEEEEEEEEKPAKRSSKRKAAAASEHSLVDIRQKCVQIEAEVKGGIKKIQALTQRFGIKKLTELEEDKYDEFYEQLEAILEDGADPAESSEPTPAKRSSKRKAAADEDEEEDEEDEEEEEEEEEVVTKRRRRTRR
jgi:hypothetical protein